MKHICKNCGYEVDFDTDEKCNGCGESGFSVIFSKEVLEPASELCYNDVMSNFGLPTNEEKCCEECPVLVASHLAPLPGFSCDKNFSCHTPKQIDI